MKRYRNLLKFSLAVMGLLLAGTAARADSLTITLSKPFQTAQDGSVIYFDATVTNNTAGDLYLNGDSFNFNAPLTLDDSPFIDNYPLFLTPSGDPGDSYTGELFAVTVPAGTPLGLYTGDFEIIGGGPSDFTDVIGSADFNVVVTPEPSSLLLLLTGVVALAGIRFRSQFNGKLFFDRAP